MIENHPIPFLSPTASPLLKIKSFAPFARMNNGNVVAFKGRPPIHTLVHHFIIFFHVNLFGN